jgi:Asp-tRNA(Asn)/Glu-tRNA(Gln) amidotransferase C subunit
MLSSKQLKDLITEPEQESGLFSSLVSRADSWFEGKKRDAKDWWGGKKEEVKSDANEWVDNKKEDIKQTAITNYDTNMESGRALVQKASNFMSETGQAISQSFNEKKGQASQVIADIKNDIEKTTSGEKGREEAERRLEAFQDSYNFIQTRMEKLDGQKWIQERENLHRRISALKERAKQSIAPTFLKHFICYFECFEGLYTNYKKPYNLYKKCEESLQKMNKAVQLDQTATHGVAGPSSFFNGAHEEANVALKELNTHFMDLLSVEQYTAQHHESTCALLQQTERALSLDDTLMIGIAGAGGRIKSLGATIKKIEQTLHILENSNAKSRAIKFNEYVARLAALKEQYAKLSKIDSFKERLDQFDQQIQELLPLIIDEDLIKKYAPEAESQPKETEVLLNTKEKGWFNFDGLLVESGVEKEELLNNRSDDEESLSITRVRAAADKKLERLSAFDQVSEKIANALGQLSGIITLNEELANVESSANALQEETDKARETLLQEDNQKHKLIHGQICTIYATDVQQEESDYARLDRIQDKWDEIAAQIGHENQERVYSALELAKKSLSSKTSECKRIDRLFDLSGEIISLVTNAHSNASERDVKINELQTHLAALKTEDHPLNKSDEGVKKSLNDLEAMIYELHKSDLHAQIVKGAVLYEQRIHQCIQYLGSILSLAEMFRAFMNHVVIPLCERFFSEESKNWDFINKFKASEGLYQKLEAKKGEFEEFLKKDIKQIKDDAKNLFTSAEACTSFDKAFEKLHILFRTTHESLGSEGLTLPEQSDLDPVKDLEKVKRHIEGNRKNITALKALSEQKSLFKSDDDRYGRLKRRPAGSPISQPKVEKEEPSWRETAGRVLDNLSGSLGSVSRYPVLGGPASRR